VPRLLALIFGTLGGVALLLQLIAIAGLASFEIGRRREEMTVRLALGATPNSLRGRLAVGIVRPIAVGVLVGLPRPSQKMAPPLSVQSVWHFSRIVV
jgi:hypothetical protein